MAQLTRNNHYVPQWYQRDFCAAGRDRLFYVDLQPERRLLPDGRTITLNEQHEWGPKKCFSEIDLYTTRFGATLNDEVEKLLFGEIDTRGAKAVRAFASGDEAAMHFAFEDFFEYMDAQKLRTPKGLDWIKAKYSGLNQTQLMIEMQGVRMMHCTLWTEGVREIVTAKNSPVKFIVTDHPVTVYNAALPPSSLDCGYPHDPSISQVGTQTIFALNPETCLILTHLEYAQSPESAALLDYRTNARYRGKGLVRTDAFIKKREFSIDEVVAVNYLLKSRAKQFIAASQELWLYPEKNHTVDWKSIAQVLLPPKDKLWGFGGEIFIGYKDGTSGYSDAFGRTSKAHEYLTKKTVPSNLGEDDACGCDSQMPYGKCCSLLTDANRPSWKLFSIRQRNLMLSNAVQDILGIADGKRTWDDVRQELSSDQVKKIHELFASLWPEDTDLQDLLPRPNSGVCRAIYMGSTDPRTVAVTVIAWLPFIDQIIIPHPFNNPQRMRPEYSPTASPNAHKAQTLKNVFALLLLEPFISAGLVHLVPDPSEFNSQFGMATMRMAEQRTKGWEPDFEKSRYRLLAEDDFRRGIMALPDRAIESMVLQHYPEATNEEVAAVVDQFRLERLKDPLILLQDFEPGEAGAQLIGFKGFSLESALFLASTTGSFIYTDEIGYWTQLKAIAVDSAKPDESGDQLIGKLDGLETLLDGRPNSVVEMLNDGKFNGLRSAFLKVIQTLVAGGEESTVTAACEELRTEFGQTQKEITVPTHKAGITLISPEGGFERPEVTRLLVTYAERMPKTKVVAAMFIDPEEAVSDS